MTEIVFISNLTTPETAYSYVPEFGDFEVHFFTLKDSVEKIISEAGDSEFIIADAMANIGENLISAFGKLKLIQSEGVGYQGIDIASAKRHGVTVCNNKGINDTAVAETAVMLILDCLKNINSCQRSVWSGRQIEAKKKCFGTVRELGECTVGLFGFGDIAKKTARLLSAFGARVLYTNRTRYFDEEEKYGVEYVTLDEMLCQSDFVSLHLAVCNETKNIVNENFLSKMKKSAYIINTARGELVDNAALLNSILDGQIAGAGLDVIAPEPVEKDNILLDERIKERLVLTPHIAGITSLTVKKIYLNAYENIIRVIEGKKPINIVT